MESFVITLAIVCYNFEKYIGEALDGAFMQTYSPLEILISDDCSTDRTWEIVQAKVAAYLGPHRITLNRNLANLGLARHENKIFELAQSDWIVFQSGDDVSVPNRVERLARAIADHPMARCLHSRCEMIAADGAPLQIPEVFKKRSRQKPEPFRSPSILGAGAVYHRDVYRVFGSLGSFVANEDHVLPLRAQLLGEIVFIDEPLVRYRKHDANLSGNFSLDKDKAAHYRKRLIFSLQQALMDLQLLENRFPERFSEIQSYRSRVEDERYVAWFLGNWQLFPQHRRYLLRTLVGSPQHVLLFVRRFVYRLIRSG